MRRISPIPSTILATLTAALALLPLLGRKPLTDWDEAIYAEVSREMLSHSWLVPHWNYQPWLEKPPLMLWITAIFFHLFGVNEFWGRAASALSGVAIVGILHLWLVRTRDALTAWLCSILLLCTLGFLHSCHTGEMDVTLALGCTIALIGLAQVGTNPSSGWLLFWIGFAMAAMTKGAGSVTLPLTALVLAVLQHWGFNHLRVGFWLGLALFLAIVLPWHLAMFHLYGGDFLREYVGYHVLARATRPIEGHITPWWFYFLVLLFSARALVLLYPVAIVHALRRKQEAANLRAFALFAIALFVFFTIVQTRLRQYMVPIYPVLAVLTAVFLADMLRPLLAAPRPGSRRLKLALAAAVISITVVLAILPDRKVPRSANGVTVFLASDSKDSTALLRNLLHRPQTIDGPLLVWHSGRVMSMPTEVFYARRPVEQVQLIPNAPEPPDRYTFNPQPTDKAVIAQPRLILLDRDLVPRIPVSFTYTAIESQGAMELGTIARAH